jgi:cyclopropane fatty-acyl-phospholipid synthase-like methyltransferase
MEFNTAQLKKISLHESKVRNFYNKRLAKIGNDIKSIGWGSKKNQFLRFELLTRNINLNKKKILDFGCGFGDLYIFLKKKFKYINYNGYDISNAIILNNKNKFSKINFFGEIKLIEKYDYIICSGVFSLRTKYTKFYFIKLINFLFARTHKGLMINFLSKKTKHKLKKNYYYSTKEIINFTSKFENCKILVYENYSLDEFTIHLLKKKNITL